MNDCEIINVPFSFKYCDDLNNEKSFYNHPAVQKLRQKFQLDVLCGYIVLLKLYNCSTCLQSEDASVSNGNISTNVAFDLDENASFFKGNMANSIAKDPR